MDEAPEIMVVAVAKYDIYNGDLSLMMFKGTFGSIKHDIEQGLVQEEGQVITLDDQYAYLWTEQLTVQSGDQFRYQVDWIAA